MKDRLKIAICVFLAVILAISLFGCTKEEAVPATTDIQNTSKTEKEDKKPKTFKMEGTSSPAAEITVSDFMDAYIASDTEKASKVCVDSKKTADTLRQYNLNDLMAYRTAEYLMLPDVTSVSARVVELCNLWFPEIISRATYEIADITQKDKDYIVTVEFKIVDINSVVSQAEIKIADILQEEYELTDTMTDEQIREALGIEPTATPEEASEILDDVLNEVIEECKGNITEDIDHAEKTEFEVKFRVTQKKNKWLINFKKSNVKELDKMHKTIALIPAQPTVPTVTPAP